MPLYEYRCEKCNQSFSLKMTMSEHEQPSIACPSCKGSSIVPQYTTFFAKTSKKS